MENRGGRGGGMLPLLVAHAVTQYWSLDNGRRPPVTAGLVAANTLIYLRPSFLRHLIPTIDQVWFNPHLIFKQWDLKRFFLSAFYHVGDPHLVYNMMSLLWKGIQLENSMGSVKFASMIAILLGMSQGITLLLAKSLLVFFDYERAYYYENSVGFSGVLFAMKVVLNSQSSGYTNVHGFLVPARHAAWAELVLIQLLVPGVSFLGHLGGILAGIIYVHFKTSYTGRDPLTAAVRSFTRLLSLPLRFVCGFYRSYRMQSSSRRLRRGHETSTSGVWRCRACTFDNSGWLSVCEVCGTGRTDDGLSYIPLSSHEIPLEELRQRRVQRFGR